MVNDYAYPGLFLIFGFFFVAGAFAVSWFLRPKAPSAAKNAPYECGEVVKGSSWIQFNVHYYLIALIFVIFDIEVLFIIPWALIFRSLGYVVYLEMMVFILILLLGLVYAWRKRVFEW